MNKDTINLIIFIAKNKPLFEYGCTEFVCCVYSGCCLMSGGWRAGGMSVGKKTQEGQIGRKHLIGRWAGVD